MNKLNTTKTIGAFIITLSILLLVFSLVDLFNRVDYITEYRTCIDISDTDATLALCKENASTGLGFKIRENQLDLSTSQYLMIYLNSLMKTLLAITILIVGTAFYHRHVETKPVPKVIENKKIVKKKKR
ncbi:MAG: hypothetical protein WCX82_02065 [archaeon]|jgi:hypothetical protein